MINVIFGSDMFGFTHKTMDITQFYDVSNDTEDITTSICKMFMRYVNSGKLSVADGEFCSDYVKNGCPLRNGKIFDDIVGHIKRTNDIDTIVRQHDCVKLVDDMKKERGDVISFTQERIHAIEMLFDTIYDGYRMSYGMYGYAGTGKTTLIMEIMRFLIIHKMIKNVAFTAPTHKALNVMKANFDKLIPEILKFVEAQNQHTFDNNILELKNHGIKIDFITIHSLLGYSMDFTKNGDRIFAKKQYTKTCKNKTPKKSEWMMYDVIIVDECSMIPLQIVVELFVEIRRLLKTTQNIPKIIFTGDPAQLPPVGEKVSAIFMNKFSSPMHNTQSSSEPQISLTFQDYVKSMAASSPMLVTLEILKDEYAKFVNDVTSMRTTTLRQIFRNSRTNMQELCYNIRQWVIGEIDHPTLGRYTGNGVMMYRYDGKNKINTLWFEKCVEKFREGGVGNIILTWTNSGSSMYNTVIRKILLGKEKLQTYEPGDILMLNDYYCFENDNGDVAKNDIATRFYTSEQLRVLNAKVITKKIPDHIECIDGCIGKLKDAPMIVKIYKNTVARINSVAKKEYNVWELSVNRLSEFNGIKSDDKEYTIYVMHDASSKQFTEAKNYVFGIIKKVSSEYQTAYDKQMGTIERYVMKPLWKYWNGKYVSQFADVIYGYSITTHKSQGSTFNDVFVDANDILQNTNENEAKRCIYTAHTRCSGEVHVLA